MKWFKHDSDANMDAKLRRVRIKYGMEGYGLYWFCLEMIARNVDQHNLSFELEHDAEVIAADTGIHFERVQEMMVYMIDLNLFERSDGIITCMQLGRRTDEYTAKLIRNLDDVRTISGQSPDKVPPIRREEKRLEQKRTEEITTPENLNSDAWQSYVQHRKELGKKKLTDRGALTSMKNLATLSHDLQAKCVEKTIANGWTGLFPEKVNEKTQRSGESFSEIHARNKQAAGL